MAKVLRQRLQSSLPQSVQMQFYLHSIMVAAVPTRSNHRHSPSSHVPYLHSIPSSHVPPPLLPKRRFPLLRVSSVQQVLVEEDEERARNGNGKSSESEGDNGGFSHFSAGLRRELLPKHLAVIMDGNRRWARLRDLPVDSGYEAGARSLRVLVDLCCKLGIQVLTVFAFSTDNWFRPKVEIEFLMSMFEQGVREELGSLLREDVRISFIGDTSKLRGSLQELIANVEESTKNNSRLQLVVAVSYSGQYDVVQACRKIALKVKDGVLMPEDISESLIEEELETNCTQFPYPDLLIRTSGELRISNFFLWQLAYTELFFAQCLWPDFGEFEFLEALRAFQSRQRRYGRKSIQ
ncbi:cis-prenyltransferase 4, chloroplastic-like [Humulus lupulus]|uniref:cis-prenyltransferase 4, chloroplastic-like n=1 Tax=Humulus lupulus TaxID=3486 RepID=UPI002B40F344|nr:cis-prenyltransferase 4, chloroplastic-like [Humulus lupulus]